MFKLFSNAWKVTEVRNKILYTLLILVIVRLGAHIALPGIDIVAIKQSMESFSTGTLYNIIAGGYNSNWSMFAMGIGPYITSSIIMQLLTVAIPKLEQLNKEGEDGRKKIRVYTRYLTVVLAVIQGIGVTRSYSGMFINPSMFTYVISVITLVVGSTLVMWLAEQITAKGITNGSSMIIFVNIVSNLPSGIQSLIYYGEGGGAKSIAMLAAMLIILLLDIVFIVLLHGGERRLPVQYSSKMLGRHSVGGRSSFMPIKVSTAGVISIIFAISLIQFPQTIGQFFSTGETFAKVVSFLNLTSPVGAAIYIVLIFIFSYFYASIVINPNEIAENMKKNGGFIPGIRPGQPTSAYITRVVNRITFVGAVSYAIVAFVPILLEWVFGFSVGFGGTTLIIVVGVCLDIVKSLESQMLMRHYKGFLNK